MAANQYESAARQGKAFKLAMHLNRHFITADLAKLQTPAEWAAVAVMAGCKWAPDRNHDETIELTLQKLTALEFAATTAGDDGDVSAEF